MVSFNRHGGTTSSHRKPEQIPPLQQFPPPIQRSRLASWWDGYQAVSKDVHLPDYLRYRLRKCLEYLPQTQQLPSHTVAIVGNDIIVTPNLHASGPPLHSPLMGRRDAGAEENNDAEESSPELDWTRAQTEAKTQEVLQRYQQAEEEAARTTSELMETRERLSEDSESLHKDIAEGKAAVPATMSRSMGQREQPDRPHTRRSTIIILAILLLAGVEGWQLMLPYLNTIGVDTNNLDAEFGRQPYNILLGAAFAIGASASLFILAHLLFQIGTSIYRGEDPLFRIGFKLMMGFCLAVLLCLAAFYVGLMRHDAGQAASALYSSLHGQEGNNHSTKALILLTLIVPIAVAYLTHQVSQVRTNAVPAGKAQGAWDNAHNEKLEVRERQEELLRLDQEQQNLLEARQRESWEKIYVLQEEAHVREMIIRHQIENERRLNQAFITSLLAALEQDRYYFLQEAMRRKAFHLLNAPNHPVGLHTDTPHLPLLPPGPDHEEKR